MVNLEDEALKECNVFNLLVCSSIIYFYFLFFIFVVVITKKVGGRLIL